MTIKPVFKCESCGKQINQPGLCSDCLKRHDRVVKFIVKIVWVLAVISFGYYYVIFIASYNSCCPG